MRNTWRRLRARHNAVGRLCLNRMRSHNFCYVANEFEELMGQEKHPKIFAAHPMADNEFARRSQKSGVCQIAFQFLLP